MDLATGLGAEGDDTEDLRLGTGEMSFANPDDEESQGGNQEGTEQSEQRRTDSEGGLVVEILTEGDGPHVPNGATVTMHYNGYLQDETLFDSSYTRGAPFKFKVGDGEVIKGWD